jgi:predicted secreted protein
LFTVAFGFLILSDVFMQPIFRPVLLAAALCLAMPAFAGPTLELNEQARASVSNDEMVIVMAAERDGPQVGALNDAVLSQLNAAIAEAKKVDGVKARLGNISTQPNYTRDGKQQGWKVRGEVVLESQRVSALGQLGGRLGERLQVSSVQFRLSTAKRRAQEQQLVTEAAQAFRAKAQQAAVAFGAAPDDDGAQFGRCDGGARSATYSRGIRGIRGERDRERHGGTDALMFHSPSLPRIESMTAATRML